MNRRVFVTGGTCLALAVAALAWKALNNPVAGRRAAFEQRLSSVGGMPVAGSESEEASEDPWRSIAVKANLWEPLIEPPAPKKQAPDLAKMLQGVRVTRDKMGQGDDLKVRVKGGKREPRGRWVGVSDTVNGLTVKSITDDAVVFMLQQGGQIYEYALPRGG